MKTVVTAALLASAAQTGWRLWFGIWCGVAVPPAIIAFLPVALLVRQRRR